MKPECIGISSGMENLLCYDLKLFAGFLFFAKLSLMQTSEEGT
jgi:hypothetical protein